MTEAISSFEMLAHSYHIRRCHILDNSLHSHQRENLKPYVIQLPYSTTRKIDWPLGRGSTIS